MHTIKIEDKHERLLRQALKVGIDHLQTAILEFDEDEIALTRVFREDLEATKELQESILSQFDNTMAEEAAERRHAETHQVECNFCKDAGPVNWGKQCRVCEQFMGPNPIKAEDK